MRLQLGDPWMSAPRQSWPLGLFSALWKSTASFVWLFQGDGACGFKLYRAGVVIVPFSRSLAGGRRELGVSFEEFECLEERKIEPQPSLRCQRDATKGRCVDVAELTSEILRPCVFQCDMRNRHGLGVICDRFDHEIELASLCWFQVIPNLLRAPSTEPE